MTGPLFLGPGGEVRVELPSMPSVVLAPPDPSPVGTVVVPVAGPAGPRGQAGDGGYEHHQVVAASVWTVPHTMGRHPSAWSLFDENGRECGEYVVQLMDLNNLRVSMDLPTAGTFRCI